MFGYLRKKVLRLFPFAMKEGLGGTFFAIKLQLPENGAASRLILTVRFDPQFPDICEPRQT
jgi:hypothetical protein